MLKSYRKEQRKQLFSNFMAVNYNQMAYEKHFANQFFLYALYRL